MKRKILFGFLSFFLLASTAYAAVAVNGLYKGRSIVKVTVNGKTVKSSVPGQIVDGATMLPLRAIAEALGARVDWDNRKYQASITTPPAPIKQGLSLAELNKIGESVGLVYQLDAQGRQIGTGSAFVTDGIAVTNNHVADGEAVSLRIDFGQKQFTVKVADAVFKSVEKDLIGFKVDGVPGLTLNTNEPKKGDKVYALGYPYHRFTITEGEYGYVSELNGNKLVHNANQEPGSSGGALISVTGEVIGISVAGFDNSSISMAIPASTLKAELDKL